MRADVIIPSNRKCQELRMFIEVYKRLYFNEGEVNFIHTGLKSSASINRNFGLIKSKESNAEFIIMMDDDIGGFFTGWHDLLIQPLIDYTDVKIVSARLITPDGELSPMMGFNYDLSNKFSTGCEVLLSACIAFRKKDILDKIWFDMEFVGSGFEDTLFTYQVSKLYPDCKFIAANDCKLIHYHEMKNQGGRFFEYNKKLFLEKCDSERLKREIMEMRAYV